MEITEEQAKELINILIENKKHLEEKLWDKNEFLKIKQNKINDLKRSYNESLEVIADLEKNAVEKSSVINIQDDQIESLKDTITNLETELKDLKTKLKNRYYYLQDGDLTQKGDEIKIDGHWKVIKEQFIGGRFSPKIYKPHRRKIN